MNSSQFRRYLVGQGCALEPGTGKGGHILVRRGKRTAVLPMHGGSKPLKTGLMNAIKKQLGID